MAIKRIVSTEFWTDKKVVEQFTPEDKLFFLYLLTNPHTTQLGVYPFITKVAAFEIGYSNDTISNLLDRFDRYGIIKYSTESGEIAVKNYLKHSIVKGGTPVYDLLVKESGQVKDKKLLQFILSANNDSENDTVRSFVNDMIMQNDNDNDNEDSYHESYHESSPQQSDKRKRFSKPTVEDIEAYCKERKNAVVARRFFDFYESKGWRVGNSPMKDWKAAIRTWEQRDKEKNPPQKEVNNADRYAITEGFKTSF